MFRKWIFLGLMVVLGAVLISLILQSRKPEPKTSPVFEVLKQSKPTALRVFSPKDLEIVNQETELVREAGRMESGGVQTSAHHRMTIRNQGSVSYGAVEIEFTYLGPGKRILGSESQHVAVLVPAGETIQIDGITTMPIPASTTRCTARILFGELVASEASESAAPAD